MSKSKSKLDLNNSREVTQRIKARMISTLEHYALQDLSEVCNFAVAYQLKMFLSKYVDENTDPPELRRHRAIVKWLAVESRNKRTNSRLYETDPSFKLPNGDRASGWSILLRAAKYVEDVIGSSPPHDLFLKGSFSGGATTSRKRGPACLVAKFMGSVDVTPSCYPHYVSSVKDAQAWTLYEPLAVKPRLVKGNVLFTVPKTTVIDRVACKEPDGNIFCQKAVGDFIRKRLKRKVNIDLNDQRVNQGLARVGSIDGSLATIDLSSASDSMTTSLVSILLPREWHDLLNSTRSPKTFIDGKSHENEMFSSMGNGFTFELESLLFYAIARSVAYHSRVRGRISVYGDDIIVPVAISRTVIAVLAWAGFKTNNDKTFVKGPFRESCGYHGYGGHDVTPFYLRRPVKDISDLILFLNQLRKWLIQTELDQVDGGYLKPNKLTLIWQEFAALVPKPLWGGYSLESRVQLVSAGFQQCELFEPTRRSLKLEEAYQNGMYLSRLCVLNKRGQCDYNLDTLEKYLDSLEQRDFSGLPIQTGRYVMRRCKVEPAVFGLVRPLFLHEQLANLL